MTYLPDRARGISYPVLDFVFPAGPKSVCLSVCVSVLITRTKRYVMFIYAPVVSLLAQRQLLEVYRPSYVA